MVRIHNRNPWANHKKEVFRPSYERIKVEIFSYDHQYTKTYLPALLNFRGTNLKKVNHRSLKCYEAKDNTTSFTTEVDYSVKSIGEYRIDIVYENKDAKDWLGEYRVGLKSKISSKIYNNSANIMSYVTRISKLNNKIKSVQELIKKAQTEYQKQNEKKQKDEKKIKEIQKTIAKYENNISKLQKSIENYTNKIGNEHKMVGGKEISFDGEKNITKRKTLFTKINEKGTYTFAVEIPANCYLIGLAIRKVITFTGDNLDSAGTNLMFKEATISKSGQIKPAEASFQIGYADIFENTRTETGFYFDYMDEVNIYVKENDDAKSNQMVRRFGGYISTISHDNDRSKITFNCADRLIDGESKYILDSLLILKGTTSQTEMEYNSPLNFNSYGQVLKYLCDIHEVTLQSNIKKNYLVEGEKYSKGLAIRFGKKKDIKDIKKIKAVNSTIKLNNNYLTVRNNASGIKPQAILLYNAKDYAKTPIRLKKVINGQTTENNLTLHMTYGLQEPAQQKQTSSTDQVSNADGSSGNFNKCGVSADGKTIMAIGTVSSAKDKGSYGTYYKTVFKNKCPHCGKAELVWDSCRAGTKCVTTGSWNGSKRSWGVAAIETEITCNSCDSDFSAQGIEKDSPWARLTVVTPTVKSSKKEQDKLYNGQMSGAGSVKVSADNIFREITKEAFKYTYQLWGETYQTYSDMKKHGKGDCWGFSDLIFTMLKKFGVKCKIVQYVTSQSNAHRSVMYMNSKGKWADFPYREYGWGTRYHNNLNNTPASKSASYVKINNAGKSIDQASGSISSTSTTTTNVTTTNGYDKNNPYQAYIEITYSNEPTWNAKKKKVNITFTQRAGTNNDITGLPNYWINNTQRQVSIDMKGWFEDNEPNRDIYLHTIRFVTPKIDAATDLTNTTDKKAWYTYDKSTHDNASCKMDLYQIIFDDRNELNPTDLQSCGKTVNALMEEIVASAKYKVHIDYGKHRCDDRIIFSVDNQTKASFVAQEGDNNNILEWSNISCSPVSVLRNTSVCVYKNSKGKYQYVDTRNAKSMLLYGEQTTLETNSEVNGSKQAYFLARNSGEFNPEFDYTFTIVVPYAPNLQLGDLVQTIALQSYLSDLKPIESIQIKYTNDNKPTIQTTLGLGEIEPYLRIKQQMANLRKQAKKKSTTFSTTASPIDDDTIYTWDQ